MQVEIKMTVAILFRSLIVRTCHTRAKPIRPSKEKGLADKVQNFVDFKKMTVVGGNGGDGCVAFTRYAHKEWAGPDGGNGGHGAHVIFQASTNMKSLSHLKTVLRGENGIQGRSRNSHGKNADHNYLEVPIGTVIKDDKGKELCSLESTEDYYIGARGGSGGHGNYFFLSNERRAPAYAENGALGENRVLLLELKTMAHAGLIGFPNAGKSTLLRAISRARPKVAAYPFTTLNPHVGMVIYDDYEQIAVADIPGLVKGAHQNRGLGHSFLRHIQRCTCLLYVLDLSVNEPWTQFNDLQFELEQYQAGLSSKPCAIVANKIDLPEAKENLRYLKEHVVGFPVLPVSAMNNVGTGQLLVHLRQLYDQHAQKKGPGC